MLQNDKTLAYREYIIYKLNKTKMIFEKGCAINAQLLWPIFDYYEFHAIKYFVKYIYKYESIVNHNIAHSKMTYKCV